MDRDRNKMEESILNLILEILFQLTGEDYIVVKKMFTNYSQTPVSEGWGRTLSPITIFHPQPQIQEEINKQKILELTNKMIELLTREVPIRCQDVAVFFSMEEWEFLEGHKDLYQDVMMEAPSTLVKSSKRTAAERCPSPLLPPDYSEENRSLPQDHQGNDLNYSDAAAIMDKEEISVQGDEECKEDVPRDHHPDGCTRSSEGHLKDSEYKADYCGIIQNTYEEHAMIPDIPSDLLSKNLSSDPFKRVFSSDSSQIIKQIISYSGGVEHVKAHTGEKPFSCSECEKSFINNAILKNHQRSHTGEKPFLCSECGKCFTLKKTLVGHQRIHTGEKPFLCSECGKCFNQKTGLLRHHRTHTGEKPFSCPECGKCFTLKSDLVAHERTHTGEKPFLCPQCGKCFTVKSHLVRHQKIHAGMKPFSCSECRKCFILKLDLDAHEKIHTEKPFSCSECGICFAMKSNLVAHEKIHTGKMLYIYLQNVANVLL